MNYPKVLVLTAMCTFNLMTAAAAGDADPSRIGNQESRKERLLGLLQNPHENPTDRYVFFRPEDAPTLRLRNWCSFWDSTAAASIVAKQATQALVEPQALIEALDHQSKVLNDRLEGGPLTLQEAVFLISHQAPIGTVRVTGELMQWAHAPAEDEEPGVDH